MASSKKRWLIASACVLALSVGAGLAFRRMGHDPEPSAPREAPQPVAKRGWQVGQEVAYALDLASRVSVGDAILQDVTLTGRWLVTATQVSDGAVTFAARVADPELTAPSAARLPEDAAKYEQELKLTLYFVTDPAGHLVEFRVPPAMSTFARGLLKAIPSYAQFARPKAAAREWSTEEADTMGRYTASYRCAFETSCSKRKTGYVELLGGSYARPSAAKVVVSRSGFEYSLASDARLLELSGDETLDVETGGGLGSMQAVSRIRLERTSAPSSLPREQLAALRTELGRLNAERPYGSEHGVRRTNLDRARFGDRRLPDLLAELGRLKKDGDQRERSRLYVAMTALFRQMPDQARQALTALRSGKDADFIIDALGDAGTEEAQSVLRTALAETRDADRRRRIVRALGHGEATDETVQLLVDLFDEHGLGGQARLALGAAAKGLERSDPERAAAVTNTIAATLVSETSPGLTVDGLRALGNAGGRTALPTVLSYLEHEDASIRAAAAQALRFVPGSDVDEVLVRVALEDESSSVRESALDATYYRDMSGTLVKGVAQSAKLDPEPSVRRVAVRSLAKWRRSSPHASDALKWVALNDANQKIREVAREALGREF